MKINYFTNRGKAYTEEEDRFIVCLMQKIGYGRWEEIKLEIRKAWQFRFDWFIKSRTPQELNRRGDLLVKLIRAEKDISEGKVPEQRREKRLLLQRTSCEKEKRRRRGKGRRGSGGGGGRGGGGDDEEEEEEEEEEESKKKNPKKKNPKKMMMKSKKTNKLTIF